MVKRPRNGGRVKELRVFLNTPDGGLVCGKCGVRPLRGSPAILIDAGRQVLCTSYCGWDKTRTNNPASQVVCSYDSYDNSKYPGPRTIHVVLSYEFVNSKLTYPAPLPRTHQRPARHACYITQILDSSLDVCAVDDKRFYWLACTT
jgi:hypothetical protein